MSYFTTTPLGREVQVGDWREYGIDQVLRLLYDFARNPINDGTLVFSLASICNATRLDIEPAMEIAKVLVERGLAEEPSSGKFRITPRGMQAVHLAPRGTTTGHYDQSDIERELHARFVAKAGRK